MKLITFILAFLFCSNIAQSQSVKMKRLDSLYLNGVFNMKSNSLNKNTKLILDVLNEIRIHNGREPLMVDTNLLYASYIHANMMKEADTLTHFFNTKYNSTGISMLYSALHKNDSLKNTSYTFNLFDDIHKILRNSSENVSMISSNPDGMSKNENTLRMLMPLFTQFSSDGHSKALTIEGSLVGLDVESNKHSLYFAIVIAEKQSNKKLGLPLNKETRSKILNDISPLIKAFREFREPTVEDFKNCKYLMKFFELK